MQEVVPGPESLDAAVEGEGQISDRELGVSAVPIETTTPDVAAAEALRWTLPACVLAWIIPGAGHLMVGRRQRALGFGALIIALFVGGLALDGKVYRPVEGDSLSYLAAFGASGVGGLYAAAYVLDLGDGDLSAPYHEYGNTFTLVAGLLNLLVILDAFDFAVLRARAARDGGAAGDDE